MPKYTPTHEQIIGTDVGTFTSWMSDYPPEVKTQLSVGLTRLGQVGRHNDTYITYEIYQIPPGTKQGDDITTDEYIQAGGKAERLTVEIRRIEQDGRPHQYTIGRAEAANEAGATEFIRFGENEVRVRPSEVLTAAEAIELFQYYYDHHKVAPGWNLRPIDQEVLTGRDA